MTADYARYDEMRDAGASPEEVYSAAMVDGIDIQHILGLLRRVFALSLVEAKEVHIKAQGYANSLQEYQEQLLDIFQEEISRESDDAVDEMENHD